MEAKRLGQVRQPWIVVPNHLLAQWSLEARDAYPNANILVASELDGRDDRQRLVKQTTVAEMNATSSRIQRKTRMVEYANVPQLIAMYDQFRDVVTAPRGRLRERSMTSGRFFAPHRDTLIRDEAGTCTAVVERG